MSQRVALSSKIPHPQTPVCLHTYVRNTSIRARMSCQSTSHCSQPSEKSPNLQDPPSPCATDVGLSAAPSPSSSAYTHASSGSLHQHPTHPCHAIPCHAIPCHRIPCHAILSHPIPSHSCPQCPNSSTAGQGPLQGLGSAGLPWERRTVYSASSTANSHPAGSLPGPPTCAGLWSKVCQRGV